MSKRIEPMHVFPTEEYQRRLTIVRREMERREIDVLLLAGPENLFHLSGYQTFGFHNYQLLVVPLDGEPFLVLRYLESMLAEHYSWLSEVITWDDTQDPVEVTKSALKARGLSSKRLAIEQNAYVLQVATWKKLTAVLGELADGSGVVEASRRIKSSAEIELMREAARLTDLGMQAAVETARPEATDNDIAAAAFGAMTRAGSEWLTRDPIVTSGRRSGIPHSCYSRQTLADGDSILLEFSGVYHRYYAPMMRTVVSGRPNDDARYLTDVCVEALNAAIDVMRPGATSAEVDGAARGVILREGLWENFRKRSGYMVGTGFTSWVEGHISSLQENDETRLEPGMVYHVPIALRRYGEIGVGMSETIVVTETGAEVLGRFPRRLFHG
jgi:Xaa-Pro dipeptidase